MKMKKNQVQINNLYSSLILKNIIPISIILILSISLSFFYNNTKNLIYKYSITISSKDVWISDNNLVKDEQIENFDYTKVLLADYLINLPKIVEKKNIFQDEESNNYTLTFETPKIIDVEDLIKKINETNKQNLYKSLKQKLKTFKAKNRFKI